MFWFVACCVVVSALEQQMLFVLYVVLDFFGMTWNLGANDAVCRAGGQVVVGK